MRTTIHLAAWLADYQQQKPVRMCLLPAGDVDLLAAQLQNSGCYDEINIWDDGDEPWVSTVQPDGSWTRFHL